MDTRRAMIYRGFTLNPNDEDIESDSGSGIGDGLTGCFVDSADFSDVDVVQFLEKRSLQDGMDAGDVYLGSRRLRMAGTLYGKTRALLYDAYFELRAALSPTLAFRDEPADKGYQPLYFSVPTNRQEDYPEGAIPMRVLVLPRAFQAVFQRDQQGGEDSKPLAIPWQATFVAKDPSIQGELPVTYDFADTTVVTGATISTGDVVTKAGHGLAIGNRIYFTALTGGTGLAVSTPYYVIAGSFTSSTFKVSLTSGGAAVNVTVAYSAASFAKVRTDAGNFVNRGNYHAPLNMIFSVGAQAGSIAVSAGGAVFTITVPASTGNRIIRFKGADKVITVEEEDEESNCMSYLGQSGIDTWPAIVTGTTAWSVTFIGVVVDIGASDGSSQWFWETYA